MKPDTIRKPAYILELKAAKDFRLMEQLCDEALAQAKQKNGTAVVTERQPGI